MRGLTFQLFGEDVSAGEAMAGIGEAAKTAIAVASSAFVGAKLGEAFNASLDSEASLSKYAASIGGAGPVSEKAGKVAGDLYAKGFGESKDDILTAVSAVGNNMVDLGTTSEAELAKIVRGAQSVGETFDVDVTQVAFAAGNMMKNGLAPDATTALDIIAKGMTTSANNGGDFLDVLGEYGGSFADVGLSGETAGAMIKAAMDTGAFSADIAADSVREFGTRMTDGSALASGAFDILGLDGEDMVAKIAAGGPAAQTAMGTIMTALGDVKDPLAQTTAGAALFGGMWEDAGASMVLSMNPATLAVQDIDGAAQAMGDTLKDNTATKVAEAERGLDGFLQKAMSLPGPMGEVVAIGAAMGPMAITAAISMGTLAKSLVTGAVPAITALNAAMRANPILAIIGVVALLVTGFITLWNTSEGFRNFFIGLWEGIKAVVEPIVSGIASFLSEIWEGIKVAIEFVWGLIKGYFEFWWELLVAIFTGNWEKIGAMLSAAWEWIKGIAATVWNSISEFFSNLWTTITSAIETAWNWIKGFFSGLWDDILAGIHSLWDTVIGWLAGVWDRITTTASEAWDKISTAITAPIKAAWTWIQETIGGIGAWFSEKFTDAKNSIFGAFDGIKEFFQKLWDNLPAGLRVALNGLIGMVNMGVDAINTILHGINWVSKFLFIPAIPDIPKIALLQLANGGIATHSTFAEIGEGSEPEAVLPLSKLDSMLEHAGGGGGGGITIQLGQGVIFGTPEQVAQKLWQIAQQARRTGAISKGALGTI